MRYKHKKGEENAIRTQLFNKEEKGTFSSTLFYFTDWIKK